MDCEPPPQHFSLARARFPLRWARRQETLTAAAREPRAIRRPCAPIIPAQARRSPAPEDFARSRRCFAGTSPLRTASRLPRLAEERRSSAVASLFPCFAELAEAKDRPFGSSAAGLGNLREAKHLREHRERIHAWTTPPRGTARQNLPGCWARTILEFQGTLVSRTARQSAAARAAPRLACRRFPRAGAAPRVFRASAARLGRARAGRPGSFPLPAIAPARPPAAAAKRLRRAMRNAVRKQPLRRADSPAAVRVPAPECWPPVPAHFAISPPVRQRRRDSARLASRDSREAAKWIAENSGTPCVTYAGSACSAFTVSANGEFSVFRCCRNPLIAGSALMARSSVGSAPFWYAPTRMRSSDAAYAARSCRIRRAFSRCSAEQTADISRLRLSRIAIGG